MTVTGLPDTVANAIDHLLNLEDEYVSGRAAVSPTVHILFAVSPSEPAALISKTYLFFHIDSEAIYMESNKLHMEAEQSFVL